MRGAPHLHLILPAPSEIGGLPTHEWLSRAWYEVVGSGDERHLRAGTGLDWSRAAGQTDPTRIAMYFLGYSTSNDKEYQNVPPPEWEGSVGRYWGVWRLKSAEITRPLSRAEFLTVRRTLRRLDRSRRRTKKVRVKRTRRATGEVYFRSVNRRSPNRSFQQSAMVGGTQFCDGSIVVKKLGELLAQDQNPTEKEATK